MPIIRVHTLIIIMMLSMLLMSCSIREKIGHKHHHHVPNSNNTNSLEQNSDWEPVTRNFDYNDFTVPMVLVPAGCFTMGTTTGQSFEQPVTEICFDEPFWLDQYEVSNTQFNQLTGNAENDASNANLPHAEISWADALAFCNDNRQARLPTEAEWEYAARGPENLLYPWGNEFNANALKCSAEDCPTDNDADSPALIGSYPQGQSWVGAYDLSGNVWEWVSTAYAPYPYNPADGRESLAVKKNRVIRGGSWVSDTDSLRTTYRDFWQADVTYPDLGFRCARDYES